MDNALIIDGVIGAVLIAGVVIGAKRGLFKSLMGLISVAAALVGAALIANALTPYVTELIFPVVRERVMERISADWPADSPAPPVGVGELLERFGVPPTGIDPYRSAVSAAEQAAQVLVSGIVHVALLLLSAVLLLVVLKLLTRALDRVFDLPLLHTANGIGGAALGLLEAALLTYAAVRVFARLDSAAIAAYAEDAWLLPLFLDHSPIEWISILTHRE